MPVRGGVVIALERMNRILEIDEANLLAVVEPNVITGDLQDAVERVGLFYPPDPASLRQSAIGGNVAECAGGPRAFKYGTTKRYVLGLEAVLPTGEIIETGGKVVKNVVGYDLTQLLVGSEGTLAIITKIILRLVPQAAGAGDAPRVLPRRRTARSQAVTNIIRERVVPAALELVDGDSLEAVAHVAADALARARGHRRHPAARSGRRAGGGAGGAARVERGVPRGGRDRSAARANDEAERAELWRVRRELSLSLRMIAPLKFNHDVVVPRGRIPELFALVDTLKAQLRAARSRRSAMPATATSTSTSWSDPERRRTRSSGRTRPSGVLFEGVVALEGSISGEHGIGFAKARFMRLELSPDEIALMKRVKQAFDPHGILNPGKIFPDDVAAAAAGSAGGAA